MVAYDVLSDETTVIADGKDSHSELLTCLSSLHPLPSPPFTPLLPNPFSPSNSCTVPASGFTMRTTLDPSHNEIYLLTVSE